MINITIVDEKKRLIDRYKDNSYIDELYYIGKTFRNSSTSLYKLTNFKFHGDGIGISFTLNRFEIQKYEGSLIIKEYIDETRIFDSIFPSYETIYKIDENDYITIHNHFIKLNNDIDKLLDDEQFD